MYKAKSSNRVLSYTIVKLYSPTMTISIARYAWIPPLISSYQHFNNLYSSLYS